jgi:hypothetical protein
MGGEEGGNLDKIDKKTIDNNRVLYRGVYKR